MVHTLYNQEVTLNKEEHRYYDREGLEYLSFSKLFNYLSPKFNADFIAGHVAKSQGVSKSEVLGTWQKATDNGTELDKALKNYARTGVVASEHLHLGDIVKEVTKKYVDYHRCYEDLVVFSKEYRVAGEIDKLSLTSNRRNCTFHISDFKRFEKGMSYEAKGQRWLNYPFDHLPNTKYTRVSMQMSFYAYLFEQLTEHKCERLFVDVITFEGGKFRNEVVPVNYMKREVEYLLEHFSNRILKELEPKVEIEDEF